MFYYLVRYSFDVDKSVFGPFDTEYDAWNAALADAENERKIDKASEWDTDMMVYEDCGEIVLVNHFADRDDTTEYMVFEL